MPFSTEVTLAKAHTPVFPNRCVVCDRVPDSKAWVAHHRIGFLWVILVPMLWLFSWKRTSIPICRGCKSKFYGQRIGRFLITITIAAVIFVLIHPYLSDIKPPFGKLIAAAIMLVGLSPYLIYLVVKPPYFDLGASGDVIEYEFASAKYAARFQKLNSDHVIASEATESPS